MSKLIDLTNNIRLLEFEPPHFASEKYLEAFKTIDLGELHASIPWTALVRDVGRRLGTKSKGLKPYFDLRAKLALMILKPYFSCSDHQLMERLRTDWSVQFFCNVYIRIEDELPNYKVISKIRCELSQVLDLQALQKEFATSWSDDMQEKHVSLSDATCYETSMRYPTDEKLLWEGCEWIYKELILLCKELGIRRPRSKYKEQKQKQLAFQKSRRKTYKMKRGRQRSLIYLLDKLINQYLTIESGYEHEFLVLPSMQRRFQTTIKMLAQQRTMFETGEDKVPNRIVSLDKDYIRPIIRGKETKRVEFGAKVNMIQVDGLNFIEHLNFEAFHEGNRLKSGIHLHQKLFGKCTHIAADSIYGTNENRKYCKRNTIQTSFVRKGRAGKNETQRSQMQSILSKQRATRMEGSFGTEKNHYGLNRVKARTEKTEILWIFFGVMTSNAVKIAKRRKKKRAEELKAQKQVA